MKKKIKEMSSEERKSYNRRQIKEWREKNPERNKMLRKKYKQSQKGKEANRKYSRKKYAKDPEEAKRRIREYYSTNPEKFISKRPPEYIKNYMKNYMLDDENHRKYLKRQKDYYRKRKNLINKFKVCQKCGSDKNLEMHHINYSKDSSIILLCRRCHRFLHRKDELNKEDLNGTRNVYKD